MRRRSPRLAVLLALVTTLASGREARADFDAAKKALLEAAKSPDWKTRRTAYVTLADYDGAPAARLALDHLVTEPSPVVLAAGGDLLAGFHSAGAVEALLAALAKGKPAERCLAAFALKADAKPAVDEALAEALSAGPNPAAALAALSLGAAGRGAGGTGALVKALASDAWQVRVAAARALAALGAGAADAVKPLVARLAVDKGRPRAEAIAALAAIAKRKIGDAPKKWEAVAAGTDPDAVTEKPALPPTFFGIPVTGERVVFVLDRSLLMRGAHPLNGEENRARLEALCTPPDGERIPTEHIVTKMQLAVAQLLHAVDGMPAGSKVEVVTFCKQVKGVFDLKWAVVSAATKKALADALGSIREEDGIDLYGALQTALDLGGPTDEKAWKAGPDEVLLVTNNVPTFGEVKDADAIAAGIGFRAHLRMVTVHVVGIGNHPFGLAQTLTRRTGGVYVDLTK